MVLFYHPGQIGNCQNYKPGNLKVISPFHTFQYHKGQMIITLLRIVKIGPPECIFFLNNTKNSILIMCAEESHFDCMGHIWGWVQYSVTEKKTMSDWGYTGIFTGPYILPHYVKTLYLHFRFHVNYFILLWKIPEEISRLNAAYFWLIPLDRNEYVDTTFYNGSGLTWNCTINGSIYYF